MAKTPKRLKMLAAQFLYDTKADQKKDQNAFAEFIHSRLRAGGLSPKELAEYVVINLPHHLRARKASDFKGKRFYPGITTNQSWVRSQAADELLALEKEGLVKSGEGRSGANSLVYYYSNSARAKGSGLKPSKYVNTNVKAVASKFIWDKHAVEDKKTLAQFIDSKLKSDGLSSKELTEYIIESMPHHLRAKSPRDFRGKEFLPGTASSGWLRIMANKQLRRLEKNDIVQREVAPDHKSANIYFYRHSDYAKRDRLKLTRGLHG